MPDGYVISPDELHRKIEETIALGGDQILLQGGMHPELTIEWYEELLRDIKRRFPQVNVHGFSPPEIDHIAARLRAADRRGAGAAEGGRAWARCPAAGRKSSSIASAARSARARPRPTAGWRSAARGTTWADAARPR